MNKQLEKFAKKIRPVYKLLNWTWWDSKGTPTEKEIAKELKRLLQELIASPKSEEISTGGLFVGREKETEDIYYGFICKEYYVK